MLTICQYKGHPCQYKGHPQICFEDMDCPACEIIAEKDKEIKDLEENFDDVIRKKEELEERIDDLVNSKERLEVLVDSLKEEIEELKQKPTD